MLNDIKRQIRVATAKLSTTEERVEFFKELQLWIMDKINEEKRLIEVADAYKRMYFGAKDKNERKDKINAFRSGNLNPQI